jgi:hypothetical protein
MEMKFLITMKTVIVISMVTAMATEFSIATAI